MKKHNGIYLIIFFLFIVGVLAFPLLTWGFVNDDFIFLHYCIKTPWTNILSFFYHGSPSNTGVYANAPIPKISFLVALYRPLLSLLIKIQATLFDLNPYTYKLVSIIIHACLSTVILNILLTFFSCSIACAGALFFAFHPSLYSWLGVLACQTYAFDLMFLLLIVWALKTFFITRKISFYFTACFLSFLSMLARETLLFLPAWIFIFTLFYLYTKNKQYFSLNHIIYALKITLGFVISHATYFMLKLYLFPFNKLDSGTGFALTPSSFITRQLERFYDIITYLCDFFGISLIPGNHQLLKGSLLIACFIIIIVPFFMQRQKILLSFFTLSFIFLNWTSILITHHSRYIYIGLPFFIFMLAYALDFYINKFTQLKKLILTTTYGALALLLISTFNNQSITARSLNIFSSAIKKLAHKPLLEQNSIYLIGLPMPWAGVGIEQGLQLYNPEFKNNVIPLRQTYINGIRFLTETHHQNITFSQEQLAQLAPEDQQSFFVSWDFQKQQFYIINFNI